MVFRIGTVMSLPSKSYRACHGDQMASMWSRDLAFVKQATVSVSEEGEGPQSIHVST